MSDDSDIIDRPLTPDDPDRWGGVELPVAVPVTADGQERTPGVGDPGLMVFASFLATVLNAEIGAAGAAMWPGMPELVKQLASGAGVPPVRTIYLFQPSDDRPFVEANLPGIFVFRYGQKTSWESFTSDVDRTNIPISMWWVAAPADPMVNEFRDPIVRAIAAAVSAAVSYGYHRAWVLDYDKTKPGTLLSTVATTLASNTVSGAAINGPLSGGSMNPSRPVLVQTLKAPGAYIPGKQVQIAGIDGRGLPWSDAMTITKADGGEDLLSTFRFRSLTSITFPPGATTTGTYTAGWGAGPGGLRGTGIVPATGFSSVYPRHAGELKTVPFKVGNTPTPWKVFEVIFEVIEDYQPNPLRHGAQSTGLVGSYALPSGAIFSQEQN